MVEASFIFRKEHIKEQFEVRYKKFKNQFDLIFERVHQSLRQHTPIDWRFTESPTSRFFILEEESEAKFLGMTYRKSQRGEELLDEIQQNLRDNLDEIWVRMKEYVDRYITEILDPNLEITHDIRTVYGKGLAAHISEEKRLHQRAHQIVSHVVPLVSKKIAARPNAVVLRDGSLWVRQYLNWVSFSQNSKEYYHLQQLTRDGVLKNTYCISSYTQNGRFQILHKSIGDRKVRSDDISCLWKEQADTGIRTENYWKLPTVIDVRLIDLDFKERYAQKGVKIAGEELIELYFLRKLTTLARRKFNL